MIGTCNKCGNHKWDKIIKDGKVICPECNNSWSYRALPLFILSGCSGVGKTTTGIEIMHRQTDVVVLDADIFCGVQNACTEDDYRRRIDTLESLSRNIAQCGINYRANELRPQLADDVKEARSLGDLSENAEYRSARRAFFRNESRLRYLKKMVKTAKVIDVISAPDEVGLFDKIEVEYERTIKEIYG